jgi:hypothetical protein
MNFRGADSVPRLVWPGSVCPVVLRAKESALTDQEEEGRWRGEPTELGTGHCQFWTIN